MRAALAGLLALLVSQCGGPAFAGMLCLPRDAMVENLRKSHGERPVAMGLDNSGVMVEVFVAPTGSWTMLLTQPNGMACLMAAGQGWETQPAKGLGT